MTEKKRSYNLYSFALSVLVLIAVLVNAPNIFIYTYLIYNSILILIALRIKDFNIVALGILMICPYYLEQVLFNLGLVSLKSSDDDRLIQNSIIFGIQASINLLPLYPLVKRMEIQSKLWPSVKIRATPADEVFPWLQLCLISLSFFCLIENYLRNGLNYQVQFFYDIFDITGYIVFSITTAIMSFMTIDSYKNHRLSILPTLRNKQT
ncbi:hypothetical protein ACFOEE_11580 [Pseudoalteromonas fenneropenaei]|uniref:Uncharacterized protein n=1 Tax=Pseudoalteromonas fenneropenaei TaxID=1737459 RepID=A0ABV7CL35_9GAMM